MLLKVAAALLALHAVNAAWVGEEYWTSIGYSGNIKGGRSADDFVRLQGAGSNAYVAYWIAKNEYGGDKFEAFGHAFVKPDGRVCAWFVGKMKDNRELCGGFRVLSRNKNRPDEQPPFELLPAAQVAPSQAVGYRGVRAGFRRDADAFFGNADVPTKTFVGVSPTEQYLVEVGSADFDSSVFLLRKTTPDEPPRKTAQEGQHDQRTHDMRHDDRGPRIGGSAGVDPRIKAFKEQQQREQANQQREDMRHDERGPRIGGSAGIDPRIKAFKDQQQREQANQQRTDPAWLEYQQKLREREEQRRQHMERYRQQMEQRRREMDERQRQQHQQQQQRIGDGVQPQQQPQQPAHNMIGDGVNVAVVGSRTQPVSPQQVRDRNGNVYQKVVGADGQEYYYADPHTGRQDIAPQPHQPHQQPHQPQHQPHQPATALDERYNSEDYLRHKANLNRIQKERLEKLGKNEPKPEPHVVPAPEEKEEPVEEEPVEEEKEEKPETEQPEEEPVVEVQPEEEPEEETPEETPEQEEEEEEVTDAPMEEEEEKTEETEIPPIEKTEEAEEVDIPFEPTEEQPDIEIPAASEEKEEQEEAAADEEEKNMSRPPPPKEVTAAPEEDETAPEEEEEKEKKKPAF